MGMNIGAKNYDSPSYQAQIARLDAVVLNFYPGWGGERSQEAMRAVVRNLKGLNPSLLVGQYTVLSEAYDPADRRYADRDKSQKVEQVGWWLRDDRGKRVQWTSRYDAWEVNITEWSRPDDEGLRYPAWLARRDLQTYFAPIPELDIWYVDNALSKPAVDAADWDGDGRRDLASEARISTAHRRGHAAHWGAIKERRPGILIVGNSDDLSSPEFTGRLQGAFLEAVIGKSWSMERWRGWEAVMDRYHKAMRDTSAPHLVGFNVWGKADDYQRMRYGLTSCLLGDGYFSYTDEAVGYSSVPWFDEYEADLGRPVDPPQTSAWQNGVYRRRFERGLVLVNPTPSRNAVRLEGGHGRMLGQQDALTNNGERVTTLELLGKDGLVLKADR